jgi:hypothetical protein
VADVFISYSQKDSFGLGMIFPSCQLEHPAASERSGYAFSCPAGGCGLQIKLNPFVVRSASGDKSWA